MPGTPLTLVGLTSAALVLASANPTHESHGVRASGVLSRGDRLTAPSAIPHEPIAIIEVSDPSDGRIVLRGTHGEVLYMTDPAIRTTAAARGAQIPRIVFGPPAGIVGTPDGAASPAREPVSGGRPNIPPLPIGCKGRIGPLADPEANRAASLCLASLEARQGS